MVVTSDAWSNGETPVLAYSLDRFHRKLDDFCGECCICQYIADHCLRSGQEPDDVQNEFSRSCNVS